MTNRQKLIDNLAKANPDLSKADVHALVTTSFAHISDELTKGNRVEVRGFGVLEPSSRNVVSPFAKDSEASKRKTVKYKASKVLLDGI
jgi:integration host factor subunit beta